MNAATFHTRDASKARTPRVRGLTPASEVERAAKKALAAHIMNDHGVVGWGPIRKKHLPTLHYPLMLDLHRLRHRQEREGA